MSPIKIQYIITFLFLSVLGWGNLSAQGNDFLKQIIKESIKTNFKQEFPDLQSLSTDSSSILSTNQEQTKLIDLDVNKKPLPKLGYSTQLNLLLIQSLIDSKKPTMKISDNLLIPYSMDMPIYNKIMDYQYLMPKSIYTHLSGNGFINLSAIAKISRIGVKQKTDSVKSIQYSEFEKATIVKKTNQLIWDALYTNKFNTEKDSMNINESFKKDSISPIHEFEKSPSY